MGVSQLVRCDCNWPSLYQKTIAAALFSVSSISSSCISQSAMRASVVVGFDVSDKLTARGTLFWIRMEFDVVFIKEHVLKELVGYYKRSMRRKYETIQRDLISIEKVQKFKTKFDFINILPNELPKTFTNRDLAEKLDVKGNKRRIQRIPGLITYSLCGLGILYRVGKRGRAYEFSIQR